MSDLISRQAAIDAIDELDWYHHGIKEMVKGANPAEHQAWYKADDVYKALDSLPSAEPKAYAASNKGEWIEIRRKKNGAVIALRCNQCLRYPKRAVRTDFCPNCGADMREDGEQDE